MENNNLINPMISFGGSLNDTIGKLEKTLNSQHEFTASNSNFFLREKNAKSTLTIADLLSFYSTNLDDVFNWTDVHIVIGCDVMTISSIGLDYDMYSIDFLNKSVKLFTFDSGKLYIAVKEGVENE